MNQRVEITNVAQIRNYQKLWPTVNNYSNLKTVITSIGHEKLFEKFGTNSIYKSNS